MISSTIQATLNAAGIVCNLAHAALYGFEDYQRLAVKNPYFLQEVIHIIAFLNEAVCNSSTGQLLRANAEAFRVEIGIPFFSYINILRREYFCLLPTFLLV